MVSGKRQRAKGAAWAPLVWWGLALAYPAIMVIASARPEFGAEFAIRLLCRAIPAIATSNARLIVVVLRKTGHFLGYCLFSIILSKAFLLVHCRDITQRARIGRVIGAALVAAAVALVDETLQVASPFRTGAGADVAIDIAGIAVGTALSLTRRIAERET